MWLSIFVVGTFWFWVLLAAMGFSLVISIKNESGFGATGTILVGALLLWLCGNVNVFSACYHHPFLFAIGCLLYFVIGVVWLFVKWEVYVRDRNNAVIETRTEYLKSHPTPTATAETITIADMQYARNLETNPFARMADGTLVKPIDKYGNPVAFTEAQLAQLKMEWEAGCVEQTTKLYERFNKELMDRLSSAGLTDINRDGDRDVIPYVRNHKAKCLTWMTYWPISMAVFFLNDAVARIFQHILDVLHGHLQGRANSIFKNTKVTVDAPR